MVSKEEKKIFGAGWWMKLLVLAMGVLLVLDSVQILTMSAVVNRVDKYNQGVVDEMGLFRGNVQSFGDDLNEIRKFLLLPEKDYNKLDAQVQTSSDEQQNSSTEIGLYAFLNQYSQEQKTAQIKITGQKAFEDLAKNADFAAKLKELNLAWQRVDGQEMQAKLIDKMAKNPDGSANVILDQPLFSVFFDVEGKLFHIQSALEDKTFEKYSDADFVSIVNKYLSENLSTARAKKIEQKNFAERDAVNSAKTAQAKLDQQKKDFETMLHEPAFIQTLTDQKLTLSGTSRQENNKLIYDVVNPVDKLEFSFALELSSGMVKVMKDGQEVNIEEFNHQEGSKKKP